MTENPLALDWVTASELGAVEFLELAARLGVGRVALFAQPVAMAPELDLHILGDTQMRRDTVRRSRDLGITIDMIDVLVVDEHCDPEAFRPAFETGALLGARWFTTQGKDNDEGRLVARLAALSAMAVEHDMRLLLEPTPRTMPATLKETVELLDAHGLDDIQIEVDSLHYFRVGSPVADIVTYASRIGRAQICDGAAGMAPDRFWEEARMYRLPPGEGGLPLQSFVDALPADIVIGVEVPNASMPLEDRVTRSLAGASHLLNSRVAA